MVPDSTQNKSNSKELSRIAMKSSGIGNFTSNRSGFYGQWKRAVAEFIGTFMLVFVAAAPSVISASSHIQIGRSASVVAPGLVVMAIIYTFGDVSGAHLNPVVTFAFALRKDFPWAHLLNYWLAQLLGSIAAVGVLRVLFGPVGHLGATIPHGITASLIMEFLLSFFLMTIIFGTAAGHKLVGHNSAIAVGGYVALAGLFASPISGASMNPVRSIGPDLVSWSSNYWWIYIIGPFAGVILATMLASFLRGKPSQDELNAADG